MSFLGAVVFYASVASATGFPTITVLAKVVSFDKETVVLISGGKRFSVPRNSISKKFKLQSGETIEVEIESPFKKKSSKTSDKK